ncbi:MAG: hypothetical protein IJC43_00485 [Clostridia bacterium]|nr:hypothetical protein [Clostridia bacterium]
MRPFKRLTFICTILSLISFTLCLGLHYGLSGEEAEFWVNVCLAVFGSSLLTALSSLVSYLHERRTSLESFLYQCKNLLHFLSKYQSGMMLEDKMRFFLDYNEIDKTAWDAAFGNFDFFFERCTGNREYIFTNIYLPLLQFNSAVNRHTVHFREYFSSGDRNIPAMEAFVTELESYLISHEKRSIPKEFDPAGNPIAFRVAIHQRNKLIHEIGSDLDGKYRRILYAKNKED